MGETSKSEILQLESQGNRSIQGSEQMPMESLVLFYHYRKKEENIDII